MALFFSLSHSVFSLCFLVFVCPSKEGVVYVPFNSSVFQQIILDLSRSKSRHIGLGNQQHIPL